MLASSAMADPIEPAAVRVIDGDTIEARGAVWRLVGFDTPETGRRARCVVEAKCKPVGGVMFGPA